MSAQRSLLALKDQTLISHVQVKSLTLYYFSSPILIFYSNYLICFYHLKCCEMRLVPEPSPLATGLQNSSGLGLKP